MSADSFHKQVEDNMTHMQGVQDWNDLIACVEKSGFAVTMQSKNLYDFKKGLSLGQKSLKEKPKVDEIVVAQFRKGTTDLYFMRSHKERHYKKHSFLKRKILKQIKNTPEMHQQQIKRVRGINCNKKVNIKKILDH